MAGGRLDDKLLGLLGQRLHGEKQRLRRLREALGLRGAKVVDGQLGEVRQVGQRRRVLPGGLELEQLAEGLGHDAELSAVQRRVARRGSRGAVRTAWLGGLIWLSLDVVVDDGNGVGGSWGGY